MTATIFVDTNVLVYARDAGEPRKQPIAADWLRELWLDQRGRTSTQVLSEYYTTVTRKLRPGLTNDEAWDDVTALLAWDPQPIDRAVIVRARDIESRYSISWWDSMIVAAAQLQNCSVLLSEDLQHGLAYGIVTVRNPFAERVEEARDSYAEPAAPRSRHRGRGRPKGAARKQPARSSDLGA